MHPWENAALQAIRRQGAYTVTLDDDPVIPVIIEGVLGVKSVSFQSTKDLMAKVPTLAPVGAFIDIHLTENESGLEILPLIASHWRDRPIIVVTGDSDESLVGRALASGASDFIAKPIRPGELVARLLARLREVEVRTRLDALQFGDLKLELVHRRLSGPRGQYFPSQKEVEILAYLIRTPGIVVEKNVLKRHVWSSVVVSDNALDRKLFEVRKAIRSTSDRVELVSIYGEGVTVRETSQTPAKES